MQLIIKRRFEPEHRLPSGSSWPYIAEFKLELTDEESKLVEHFKLADHVLSRSERRMTHLGDVIQGTQQRVPSLDFSSTMRTSCGALVPTCQRCLTTADRSAQS